MDYSQRSNRKLRSIMKYKYGIVINQNSGSVTPNLREDLELTLENSTLDYELKFVDGKEMSSTAESLVKAGCTALAAGGGDGSMAPIAAIAANHNIPFAALPFGTLNHFAKDMQIPTDLIDLVEMLSDGKTKNIDYATVNNHPFLNNSSIGIYPELVIRREDREQKIGKWPAAALSFAEIFHKPLRAYSLTIIQDGVTSNVRSPFVFVGNNDYGIDSLGINSRSSLEQGHLCLYIYRGESRGQLLWQLIRSIFGRPANTILKATHPKEVIIKSNHGKFALSFDGEAIEESSPLKFQIHTKKLSVIVPK
jgi:diacylglycerol kinase family enzyme